MKFTKPQLSNILLLLIIVIMILPQTRQPIQILLHKGLALFNPSVVDEDEQVKITDYDWKLIESNGNTFNFKDAKGKVIVVNFWATWCPPCIAEMPSLEKLYQDYKEDVVFLLVSNEDQEAIAKFKHKYDYSFVVYSSISATPKQFDQSSIPKTYIIDKEGQVVINTSGAANWNSEKVRNLLNALLKS